MAAAGVAAVALTGVVANLCPPPLRTRSTLSFMPPVWVEPL
jgi:hypothetical protein